jgi:hypothetical protein
LVACVDEIGEWVTGKRSDLFHGIVRRHGMLRKFSPALLDALELTQDIEGEQSACLRALQMLKELKATGRRKLREDAPTDFLTQRLKPIVINQGEIDPGEAHAPRETARPPHRSRQSAWLYPQFPYACSARGSFARRHLRRPGRGHGARLQPRRHTMARLTSDVTYDQLKRIGDWHLTEEAQRSALAQLVSAIADLDTSLRWGEGRTAASDGQRFSLPRRVSPADLQHPIQRLRLGVLYFRG